MKIVLIAFGLIAATLGGASVTLACSCAPPPPPKTALAQSHAVFVGKVTKIDGGEGRSVSVTLEATTTWKGVAEKNVVVQTASDSAACGFTFEVGKSYLVYAYLTGEEGAKDRALATNICTRTHLVDDRAKEDIAELGPPEKMPPN